jgi:hypothetical protein
MTVVRGVTRRMVFKGIVQTTDTYPVGLVSGWQTPNGSALSQSQTIWLSVARVSYSDPIYSIALQYGRRTNLGRALTSQVIDLGKMPYIVFFGYTGH